MDIAGHTLREPEIAEVVVGALLERTVGIAEGNGPHHGPAMGVVGDRQNAADRVSVGLMERVAEIHRVTGGIVLSLLGDIFADARSGV